MSSRPELSENPTYRELQAYLGYLRDDEQHPLLQDFDLGQKKDVLKAKVEEIKKAEIEPKATKQPTQSVKPCRVCGDVMLLDDGWFKCGNCGNKEPSRF